MLGAVQSDIKVGVTKVLLVYEDMNEMNLTINSLKKVGFDVVGISNEVLLIDQVYSFNPDIVVANGRNVRVSTFSVSQKLREMKQFNGKVALVVPKGTRPSKDELLRMRMDAILEMPLTHERLIQVLSKISGKDAEAQLQKFSKSTYEQEQEKAVAVTGKIPTGTEGDDSSSPAAREAKKRFADPVRKAKYEKLANDTKIDLHATSHDRLDVTGFQRELKKDYDFEKLNEIDHLKREFVKALFKKEK